MKTYVLHLLIELTTDKKEDLRIFLEKRKFNYAVVASQGNYMINRLGITAYPTHILINRDGKILKVTNTIEELIPFLTITTKM